MRTVTTTQVLTEVEHLQFGVWNEGTEEFIPIESGDTTARQIAAEHLKCSAEMIEALTMFADTICDALKSDLIDIWKRLDEAGV